MNVYKQLSTVSLR